MRRVEAESIPFGVKDLIVLTLTPSKSTFFIIPCSAKPYAGRCTGRNFFQLRNDGTARGLHEKRWPIAFSMETWNIFSRYGSRKRKESQGNAIAKCQCRLWNAMFPPAKDSFLGVYPPCWAQGISDKCAWCLKSGWAECYMPTSVKCPSFESLKSLGFRQLFSELCWLCRKNHKLEIIWPEALNNTWES